MFAVIFEVQPKPERWDDYLAQARYLRPRLEAIDGFVANERFESVARKGRLLSLSLWRDEKAVIRWRTQGDHHGVQEKGRFEIFEDYRLRVGEIAEAGGGRTRLDATEVGEAKALTLTALTDGALPGPSGALAPIAHETFESIAMPGKRLLLFAWREPASAALWRPAAPTGAGAFEHHLVHVIRDYGMFDRREAPQYFPERTPGRPVH